MNAPVLCVSNHMHNCWFTSRIQGLLRQGSHSSRKALYLKQRLKPLKAREVGLESVSEYLQAFTKQVAGGRNTTGVWKKDKQHSDSMEEPCEAVQLNWVLRKALGLLNTLEVEETVDHFKTVIKAGGVMDVAECYPFSSETVSHKRRDKRAGHHTGQVLRTAEGHPAIRVVWDNPYGGVCTDVFVLSEDGQTLTQLTEMDIRDTERNCRYKTVYRRAR